MQETIIEVNMELGDSDHQAVDDIFTHQQDNDMTAASQDEWQDIENEGDTELVHLLLSRVRIGSLLLIAFTLFGRKTHQSQYHDFRPHEQYS